LLKLSSLASISNCEHLLDQSNSLETLIFQPMKFSVEVISFQIIHPFW